MSNHIKDSQEKATPDHPGENSEAKNETPATRRIKGLHEWDDLVSRRIEEAMSDGAFDNLPGRGKPLKQRRNQHVPADMQLAFNLLEDHDLPPQWIGDRAELQRAIEKLRTTIQRQAEWHRTRLDSTQDPHAQLRLTESWAYFVQQWEDEIKELNRRILTLNLKQPVAHLELLQLRLDEELARLKINRKLTV